MARAPPPPPGTAEAGRELLCHGAAALRGEGDGMWAALVQGASGTGKTALAHWLVSRLCVSAEWAEGADVGSMGINQVGRLERDVEAVFARAVVKAPCVLVVENADCLAPISETGFDRRLASAWKHGLESLAGKRVFVLALSTVGPAELARAATAGPHRLAITLELGTLDVHQRTLALRGAARDLQVVVVDDGGSGIDQDAFWSSIAELCRGYSLGGCARIAQQAQSLGRCEAKRTVVAKAAVVRAVTHSSNRTAAAPQALFGGAARWLTLNDLEEADLDLAGVDIDRRRRALREATLLPLRSDDAMRLRPGCGAVLYGETGTGKTTLARAMAREACMLGFSIMAVDCGGLLQSTLGASERNVRAVMALAREQAPCVVLLDQLDSLGAPRGRDTTSEGSLDRVLGTLLIEMDGVHRADRVSFIATAHRINDLDDALLRPGRLGARIQLTKPDQNDRQAILEAKLAKTPLDDAARGLLGRVAALTGGATGADLGGVCQRAALACLRERLASGGALDDSGDLGLVVTAKHLQEALPALLATA
ncbi:P-loop containing nucleoside triphosphate hydrolase protein [Pelagophyceae sp. CCMP2097]|nr:P-loop containing nucleoside triphosphate hydrolase protein [Pelagophyceae sp. CCMP2097]